MDTSFQMACAAPMIPRLRLLLRILHLERGYVESTPLDGSIGVKPFDPAVGTGPTVIIPAAALVYVLGNVPWAPGFATATVSFSLLVFLAFDESHDFAFSFIVFQYIPSTEVIASYCREVCRVLRPGSLFKFQVNGVVWKRHDSPDTWVGVSFAEAMSVVYADGVDSSGR